MSKLTVTAAPPEETAPARTRVATLRARLRMRAETRRVAALEQRTALLTGALTGEAAESRDLGATMRVAWELVAALRSTLLSLEERATRVVPAQTAALIALWTQIHTFGRSWAQVFIWSAWTLLVIAVLSLARLVMPSRLDRFWSSLVPPEVVLADLKPIAPTEEATLATHMSSALHAQIERLRAGFRFSVSVSAAALMLAAVGYVIERW